MATWKIDQAHSEVKFKVKHLVVSTVTGQFTQFDATIESEKPDFTDAKISFEADVNSISTNNEMRDGHLRTSDFFDAENHPKLTFESSSVTKKSDDEYEVRGNLTIRGNSKEIPLKVVFNGIAQGFDGKDVAGFEISGKLNRKDFGLHWNGVTEAGGIVVSDEVRLEINAEMKKP